MVLLLVFVDTEVADFLGLFILLGSVFFISSIFPVYIGYRNRFKSESSSDTVSWSNESFSSCVMTIISFVDD